MASASPSVVHVPEHDLVIESEPATAVVSPTDSKVGSARVSVYEKSFDSEKGDEFSDEHSLAAYVVPVLDKGVKSALTAPISRWTKFRIWYNPYRQVSLSRRFGPVENFSLSRQIAFHLCACFELGRHCGGCLWALPLCYQAHSRRCPGQCSRCCFHS
jgi:hypothetical protein